MDQPEYILGNERVQCTLTLLTHRSLSHGVNVMETLRHRSSVRYIVDDLLETLQSVLTRQQNYLSIARSLHPQMLPKPTQSNKIVNSLSVYGPCPPETYTLALTAKQRGKY